MPRWKEFRSQRRWEQGEKTGKWCERWIVYIVSRRWEERKKRRAEREGKEEQHRKSGKSRTRQWARGESEDSRADSHPRFRTVIWAAG